MKRFLLSLFLFLIHQICIAQNTFPETGYVGIGLTNPGVNLHLQNLEQNSGIVGLVQNKMNPSLGK